MIVQNLAMIVQNLAMIVQNLGVFCLGVKDLGDRYLACTYCPC